MEGITIQEDELEEDVSPVVTDDDEEATDDDGDADDTEDGSEDEGLEHDNGVGSARERSASGAQAGVSGRGNQSGPAAERIQRGASRQAELEVCRAIHAVLLQTTHLLILSCSIAGTASLPAFPAVHSPGRRQACKSLS